MSPQIKAKSGSWDRVKWGVMSQTEIREDFSRMAELRCQQKERVSFEQRPFQWRTRASAKALRQELTLHTLWEPTGVKWNSSLHNFLLFLRIINHIRIQICQKRKCGKGSQISVWKKEICQSSKYKNDWKRCYCDDKAKNRDSQKKI